MKKPKINTSLPAYLSDFASEENEKFSRAKLKVFYIGETADHRLFTENFAKELIKTLPYTPVVTQYDAEEDDFNGHAAEQNIYGIVDPCGKVSFEEEDGKQWAVCDVVLYTERRDMVGTIAKKIPGMAQSLEMDPKTVQYTVNYDKKMKIKNIEFTKGEFVGVSVLGKKQRPAFTGSAFFNANNEDFQHKMEILKDYCQTKEERGIVMNETMNFVELSWGEKSKTIFEALEARYGQYCVYPVDWFDNCVVAQIYFEQTDEVVLTRIYFTVNEDGTVELGDAEKVRVSYETVVNKPTEEVNAEVIEEETKEVNAEEIETETTEEVVEAEEQVEATEQQEEAAEEPKEEVTEEDAVENATVEEEIVEAETEEIEEEKQPVEEEKEEIAENLESAQEENAQDSIVEETTVLNNEEEGDAEFEEAANSSTLTDSERQELESLKRDKKRELISSYENDLSEEILNEFSEKIDSFEVEDLENELAKTYRREQQKSKSSKIRTFSILPVAGERTEKQHLADLVNKYKSK